MARRKTVELEAPAKPKPADREGLTWYGLTATTHTHACGCGQEIGCARPEPCAIRWKCGAHRAVVGAKCAWCNGTGTYVRAMLGRVDTDSVACGYCFGSGAAA